MDIGNEVPLILGRPFLSTTDGQIDVGVGVIRLHINGKEERFEFRPREEQCSKAHQERALLPKEVKLRNHKWTTSLPL
jgi:hypothetical protein